jgi:pimeloyl-ACP methyl ester carboxylesterase
MSGIEAWWSAGQRVRLVVGRDERSVFARTLGNGPHVTLLHGFPSSSHDWERVATVLARERSLLAFDFLGFGASEKPVEHEYSLHEQADLVEAVWAREGVTSTVLLGHDYAVSVVQELFARRAEDALVVKLEGACLLNGGVFPDLHRPQPMQTALLDPEQGPKISALVNEELFVAGLGPTFADGYDATEDSVEIWKSIHRDGGERIMHRLIRYMTDREAHGERWVAALETTDVPLSFAWGMLDPVSGAHMAQRIRERLPAARFRALEHVGHWPALEAPQAVADALLSVGSPG